MQDKPRISVREMTLISLMTAILCIFGPFAIPLGAIPISLTNFILFLLLYISGIRCTLISYFLYLLLGAVGLPVFSGFSGGLTRLAGPTGGYLMGFIILIFISGICICQKKGFIFDIIGMILGMLFAYLCGTIWFCFQMKTTILYAMNVCVFPFLPGDAIKIFLAAKLGPSIKKRITKNKQL
ncbi:MAG: biotin transporter BioY [Lachnospiraceae bacterium]|nr:biotin transporter BioY [Lachnospiraceae bacterium]